MVHGHDITVARVLVAADTQEALVAAVEKTALIEHYTGAAVTALLVTYDPVTDILAERYSSDAAQRMVDQFVSGERRALDAALAPSRKRIADLDVDVIFARELAHAISAAAHAVKADLIVKPMGRSAHRVDFLHAPADWQLMREAPCPVLFTRSPQWRKPIRVLAALDVMDAAHAALNDELIRRAELLKSILGGELHVATAYPAFAPYVALYQDTGDLTSVVAQAREVRHDALARLLERLRIDSATIHVEQGRARDVIHALAVTLDANLTVVGTAGRSGLTKLLIGNTAEQVIGDLATDLLTVRAPEQAI